MPSSFRLVMRSGPTAGKVFPLDKGEILIGRDLNNEVVINDPEISRRHARLYLQGNTYVLEDLGSTNGTFVGGQRLTGPYPLRIGEVITLGERVTLVFELNLPDADATVASASVQAAQPGPVQPPVQPAPGYPQAQPAPTPAYPPPAGAGYQGQAPLPSQGAYAGQVPYVAEPEQPRSQNRTVMILLIILAVILVVTCLCIGIFLWNAPLEFWCQFPIWPAGACP